MKDVTREMIRIYKLKNHDWLNFKIVKMEDITFHHIKKDEDGGKYNIDNGALLTDIAHQYLHCIERHDLDIYNAINRVFKEINEQGCGPTQNQIEKLEKIMCFFDKLYAVDLVKGRYSYEEKVIISLDRRHSFQNGNYNYEIPFKQRNNKCKTKKRKK